MITFAVVVIVIAALGVASILDWTPDTRDREYGLGPFFSHHRKGAAGLARRSDVASGTRTG